MRHEKTMMVPGAKEFKTRDEAKAAMAEFMENAMSGADAKVIEDAAQVASKNVDLLAKDLFEPRDISVTLPAIRSAGDVDMEAAYTLLSTAEGDDKGKGALDAYTALGVEHKKADGSTDVVGNYGVLCGSASAKVLAGDLAGAWQDTKQAWQAFPSGKEHRLIAKVLKDQEKQAGIEIIPKEEFEEMVNADQKMMADQLKNLFGGGKK